MFWIHKYWKLAIPAVVIIATYIITSVIGWAGLMIASYALFAAYKVGKSNGVQRLISLFKAAKQLSEQQK